MQKGYDSTRLVLPYALVFHKPEDGGEGKSRCFPFFAKATEAQSCHSFFVNICRHHRNKDLFKTLNACLTRSRKYGRVSEEAERHERGDKRETLERDVGLY